MLFRQGDIQAVVGGAGLQLKIERDAEPFAQRQSPGFVDASAKGSMDDKLHAAAFIEEAFRNDALHGRHSTQHGASGNDVFDGLLRPGIIKAAFLFQPFHRMEHLSRLLVDEARNRVWSQIADVLAQFADLLREFLGASGSFTQPKRNRGRSTVGILHQHAPGTLDAADAPACVAQQNNVALEALDSEIFVQGAHHHAFRLRHYRIEGSLGNSAAIHDGDHARAAPRLEPIVHTIAIEIRAIASTLGGNAFREHDQQVVIVFAAQLAVLISAGDSSK